MNVDTHIADLVRLVRDHELHGVTLVGHSGANMAVTGAADRIPDRVSRLVYVDSGPMPSGMASADFHGPRARQELLDRAVASDDGWLIPVPPFDAAADPVNLAGLADEQLALLRSRGTPQPSSTATQPLDRPDPRPAVPASVIATTFTPEQGRALAESGNPVFAEMAGIELHHLPTGHWPMFSRPAELAGLLATLAGPEHAQ